MKEIDFWYCWGIFRNSWKTIIISAFFCAAIAFGISKFIIKPKYKAATTMYFGQLQEPTNANFLDETNRLITIGGQLANDYRELLKTNSIKETDNSVDSKGNPILGVNDILAQRLLQLQAATPGFDYAESRVIVEPIDRTRLLRIAVVSHDPVTCVEVANAYGEAFQNKVEGLIGLKNAKIVDRAIVPEIPISPNKKLNTALGFVLGFAISYLFFFLRSFLDTTIRTPNQASDVLNLPVLGTIPDDKRFGSDKTRKSEIVVLEDALKSDSNISENFRTLRVNLQYDGTENESGAKVIVVTSTLPSEGKSFNASNLAVALAESGKKTLLVNCDLRKPTLQKIFNVAAEKGLVNCLAGENKVEDVIVRDIKIPGLDVIFCGPVPPNPAKLFISKRFSNLIKELRAQYDYILLDAPPVLAVSDALVAARSADGVLFVVRAGYISESAVKEAVNQMLQNKLNLVGVILNRFSYENAGNYGYGYGYGYGYKYGATEHEKRSFWKKIRNFIKI